MTRRIKENEAEKKQGRRGKSRCEDEGRGTEREREVCPGSAMRKPISAWYSTSPR